MQCDFRGHKSKNTENLHPQFVLPWCVLPAVVRFDVRGLLLGGLTLLPQTGVVMSEVAQGGWWWVGVLAGLGQRRDETLAQGDGRAHATPYPP